MYIEASDVGNLERQRVSVMFGGTDFSETQLVLKDSEQGGYKIVLHVLKNTSGGVLVDSRANGNSGNSLVGTELVSFTGNGKAHYRVEIRSGEFDPVPLAGREYYGTLTYNIALADS